MSIREMKKREKRNMLKVPLLVPCEHAHIYVSLNEKTNCLNFEVVVRANGRCKVRLSKKLIKRVIR